MPSKVCARGGFTVDIEWKNGNLVSATIHSLNGNPVTLRYGELTHAVELKAGGTSRWT